MTTRRGATLPVSATLGHAESSNLGPTAGNGFYKRWPDDLALLAEAGVTDLRLTFDWARMQPKPGEMSGDWVERYQNVLGAAEAVGIRVWAALHDDGVPKWFDNEGDLSGEAAVRWWPRWVERVADRFGDHVHGWIPFAVVPTDLPAAAWKDTWTILGGDDAPVILSAGAVDLERLLAAKRDEFDLIGIALDTGITVDTDTDTDTGDAGAEALPSDDDLRRMGERWQTLIEATVDAVDGANVAISRFTSEHADPGAAGALTARLVEVIDAIDAIEVSFFEPAISGHDSSLGLFDRDRQRQPAADAYFTDDGVSAD